MCGGNIAVELDHQYKNQAFRCFDKENNVYSAMAGSGLILQGVHDIPKKKPCAWSLKELNKKTGSFSVAYLRIDAPFEDFFGDYKSGIIYHSPLNTPDGMYKITPICGYPTDGATDFRTENHRCTKSLQKYDSTGTSNYCHLQEIDTVDKWIEHLNSLIKQGRENNLPPAICAFDLSKSNAPDVFHLILGAAKHFRNTGLYTFYTPIEILVSAWKTEDPRKIPIKVFFYIYGSDTGLVEALTHSEQYYNLTCIEVPVVGLRLPTKNSNLDIKIVHNLSYSNPCIIF